MISLTCRAAVVIGALSLCSPAVAQTDLRAGGSPDVVLEWNAIAYFMVATQDGVEQVRLAAITHLAMFEAVNAIVGDFEPYLGTVVAPAKASPQAAAVAAAHRVLRNYLPDDQAKPLDEARQMSLGRIPDGPEKEAGIIVGEAAAQAMILHREGDGAQPKERYSPESHDPGQWQQTPSCMEQGGLFLHWRNLTPFGIGRSDRFRADPPPPLTSRRFARAYNEVMAVGGELSEKRPEDRALVARFFTALSQATWNPIARQIAAARRSSLSDNARVFALLNMAMNDALIAVMDTKYHYTFWRPETAIRAGDSDDNLRTEPDATFKPFIATPCHPSFPSAHASASNAAREVLEQLFGDRRQFVTMSSPAVPGVELRYTRLAQITRDIDDARVYGGIHYRFDQEAGVRQGCQVARYVVQHHLRRLKKPHDVNQTRTDRHLSPCDASRN
jgi:hypothetical protein